MSSCRRFILTGMPGSGKTSLLQALAAQGYDTIPEAATDVITQQQSAGVAQPWTRPAFLTDILALQQQRLGRASAQASQLQFYDRSPLCTYALALYFGITPPDALQEAVASAHLDYQNTVFFVENLGFIVNTPARQIDGDQALLFEQIHKDTYAQFGYTCVHIPAAPVEARVAQVRHLVQMHAMTQPCHRT